MVQTSVQLRRRDVLHGGVVAATAPVGVGVSSGETTGGGCAELLIKAGTQHTIELDATETYDAVTIEETGALVLEDSGGLALREDWWTPYTNADGTVDTQGVLAAITDWRDDDITTAALLDVINAWRSAETVSC